MHFSGSLNNHYFIIWQNRRFHRVLPDINNFLFCVVLTMLVNYAWTAIAVIRYLEIYCFWNSEKFLFDNFNYLKSCNENISVVRRCTCKPKSRCTVQDCPVGLRRRVRKHATGYPGNCCDQFDCINGMLSLLLLFWCLSNHNHSGWRHLRHSNDVETSNGSRFLTLCICFQM